MAAVLAAPKVTSCLFLKCRISVSTFRAPQDLEKEPYCHPQLTQRGAEAAHAAIR